MGVGRLGDAGGNGARRSSRGGAQATGAGRIHTLIEASVGFIVAVISAGGYGGIAALMALESACLPLPSEIIMPFAGYLVSTGRFDLVSVATAGAIGCNLGSTVAWVIGHWGGRPLAERLGRFVLIDRSELDWMDRFFAKYGALTVFVARLLPGIRTYIALPAGVAHMRQLPFQLYTFLGSWPWCFGLAYIGMKLGERWNSDPCLQSVFRKSEEVILAAMVLGFVAYVWWRLRRNAQHRAAHPARDQAQGKD